MTSNWSDSSRVLTRGVVLCKYWASFLAQFSKQCHDSSATGGVRIGCCQLKKLCKFSTKDAWLALIRTALPLESMIQLISIPATKTVPPTCPAAFPHLWFSGNSWKPFVRIEMSDTFFHNSGWLQRNRLVFGAFCTIFRVDSESGLKIAKFDFFKNSKSRSSGTSEEFHCIPH